MSVYQLLHLTLLSSEVGELQGKLSLSLGTSDTFTEGHVHVGVQFRGKSSGGDVVS